LPKQRRRKRKTKM